MFDWIWQNLLEHIGNFLFVSIPLWAWLIAAALAFAWVWKTFGKEGLITLGLVVLSFFTYRQGWKDSTKGDKPRVPISPSKVETTKSKPTVKKRESLEERLKRITGG